MNDLRGWGLSAIDDELGKVIDFLFDDRDWSVRYIDVDTGKWITGRRVLISPQSVEPVEADQKVLPVRLTRSQIENAPPIELDRPVSRRMEEEMADYYGWAPYWSVAPIPAGGIPSVRRDTERELGEDRPTTPRPQLRSEEEVIGYHVDSADGEIGRVGDMILDTGRWAIRYLVVHTSNWLPGRKVLIAPRSCTHISWLDSLLHADLTKGQIEDCPEYDPSQPIEDHM